MNAVDAEGNILKVGDYVDFKCDIEQVGRVTKILSRNQVELTSDRDRGFSGDYIGGDRTTIEDGNRCWKEN